MALRLSTGLRNKLLGINTELITNGAFTSVTTGWTGSNANLASAASGQSGNCLSIAEINGADPGRAYQDISTIIGRLYRLTLYFKKGTSDYGAFYIGTTATYNAIYTKAALADVAWTQYSAWFVATATTTRITLESTDGTAGELSYFDTVSCVDMARSFQDIFYLGFIDVYSGVQPASGDIASTSYTLLATISNGGGGTGITFQDAASGITYGNDSTPGTESWYGTVVSAGTAGWARLRTATDDGLASTTEERLDGAVATSGGEFNFPNGVSWALSSVQTLTSFKLTLPTA